MGFMFVVLGGIVEIFWVIGLKYAHNFWLHVLTIMGICISFTCMILACKRMEVSIAYSIFVGIGTAGVVVAEMLVFSEKINIMRITLIAILLIGIIGLKMVSREQK